MNRKFKNLHVCYNCGDDLNLVPRNEEDIPARNLFVDSKDNSEIIKVPSCVKCNSLYAKTDEDLRDLLGWLNDSLTASKSLTGKTIRSLFVHEKDGFQRLSTNDPKYTLEFNVGNIYTSHSKNFKGIYTWENLAPLGKDYQIKVIDNYCDKEKFDAILPDVQKLTADLKWQVSGKEDVFKYKIIGVDSNFVPLIAGAAPRDKTPLWIAEMIYHNDVHAIVLATNDSEILKGLGLDNKV